MIKSIAARIEQGYRTYGYPEIAPEMPPRFLGRPEIDRSLCRGECRQCIETCPVDAVSRGADGQIGIDLGRCIFCGDCAAACPDKALSFSRDYRLAASRRQDLHAGSEAPRLAQALREETRRIFGRSLKLRQVSAGGCNACEADTNVLNTLVFDLGRFGIQFVASPRHADGLLITGPVPRNMALALRKTYDAVPDPRIVIAVGACAIAGGPFLGFEEGNTGTGDIPIDLYVPGCPPHPYTILDGLLRMLGRIK
jgi:Ni,Fe-hydrogenase III small subunit/ferredoxin